MPTQYFSCYQFPCKESTILTPKHGSRCFRVNSRNIIGRNPSTVIPLLANQDLTPMLGSYRFENQGEKHLQVLGISLNSLKTR